MDRTDNRSLADLVSELSRETGQLVRKEVELATTELTAKARRAGAHVGIAAAGGALIHAGLLVLLATIVIALTQLGLAAWLSALIVAVITMVCGYAMLNRGLSRLRSTPLVPHQTMESLKEDARWTTRQGA
jgi:hypothetical protein